jgi:hypothetical protein
MKYNINIGDKILDWTVLDNTPAKVGSAYKIKCQCKCGTIKFVNKSDLIRQGYPKNCGCDKEPHTTYRNKELKKELEGKIFYNFYGTPMKVIEYKNSSNVLIEFQDEHKFRKTVPHARTEQPRNRQNDKNGIGYNIRPFFIKCLREIVNKIGRFKIPYNAAVDLVSKPDIIKQSATTRATQIRTQRRQ